MSRSGYCDDIDDILQFGRWRGMVSSAIRGKRGQVFLKEMLAALDAMPIKRLIADDLEATDMVSFSHWGMFETDSVCAIGAVGRARDVEMSEIDPEDYDTVAGTFGIAPVLAQEIVYMNDEAGAWRERHRSSGSSECENGSSPTSNRIRPMQPDWQPISTAPRDGTRVELTDEAWGEVWPMRWEVFRGSREDGIWVMWGFTGSLLATWPEGSPGDGGPTHWRPIGTRAAEAGRP